MSPGGKSCEPNLAHTSNAPVPKQTYFTVGY